MKSEWTKRFPPNLTTYQEKSTFINIVMVYNWSYCIINKVEHKLKNICKSKKMQSKIKKKMKWANRNGSQNYPEVEINRQECTTCILNMFMDLRERIVILREHMGTLSREMKTIFKRSKLKLKNWIIKYWKWKIYLSLTSDWRHESVGGLENRSIKIIWITEKTVWKINEWSHGDR